MLIQIYVYLLVYLYLASSLGDYWLIIMFRHFLIKIKFSIKNLFQFKDRTALKIFSSTLRADFILPFVQTQIEEKLLNLKK